jgi:TIR domain
VRRTAPEDGDAPQQSALSPKEVFLSHAHQDVRFVRRFAEDLRRHNVPVWFSERNIAGARQWMDEIGEALDRCDWLIVVLTPAAVTSIWVKREVSFALNEQQYGDRVIPLLLKECVPKKLAWPLATIQTIDARPYDEGLRKLLAIWGIRYRGI